MQLIRSAIVGAAMALALVDAAAADRVPQLPEEWAVYIDAVRKADAITNDEARCLAHPDLPGNQWRPGAARARCSLLREPAWSLDQIDGLLATDEGATELDGRFSALLDAHYRDPAQREQIFRAYTVFDASDRAGAVSKRWLQRAPKSAYANAAAASHLAEAGWTARGTAYVARTPKAKIETMGQRFAAAVPLYLKALEIEPRLSPACVALAAIGRQSSDALQQYAMAACVKVDPDSYHVAWEGIRASQPRWGGSDVQLRSAVAYAAARVDRNPIMGALLGEAAGYAPSVADDFGDVIDELVGAARMAPSGTLINYAGRGFRANNDDWSAVGYFSQALRFWPRDADFREDRATQLRRLGYLDWALRDQGVALEEQPDKGLSLYKMGQIQRMLHGEAAGRPYFKRAMEHSDSREPAMGLYCQSFVLGQLMPDEAGDCTRQLVQDYPESGEAWRLRAYVLYKSHAKGAIAAIDRFIRYADPESPTHQSMVPAMQEWKAQLEDANRGGE